MRFHRSTPRGVSIRGRIGFSWCNNCWYGSLPALCGNNSNRQQNQKQQCRKEGKDAAKICAGLWLMLPERTPPLHHPQMAMNAAASSSTRKKPVVSSYCWSVSSGDTAASHYRTTQSTRSARYQKYVKWFIHDSKIALSLSLVNFRFHAKYFCLFHSYRQMKREDNYSPGADHCQHCMVELSTKRCVHIHIHAFNNYR